MIWLVLIAVVVVGAAIFVLLVQRRAGTDDIATFRRQIDALSHEARRPTIERMKPQSPQGSDEDGADGS